MSREWSQISHHCITDSAAPPSPFTDQLGFPVDPVLVDTVNTRLVAVSLRYVAGIMYLWGNAAHSEF